jgi:hypothetical protein
MVKKETWMSSLWLNDFPPKIKESDPLHSTFPIASK